MCAFIPYAFNEISPASFGNNNGGTFNIPVELLRIKDIFIIKTEINEEGKFIIYVKTTKKVLNAISAANILIKLKDMAIRFY